MMGDSNAETLEKFFCLNLDLLCMFDSAGRLLRVSDAWETALGCPVAEIQGRNILEFILPEDIPVAVAQAGKDHIRNFVIRLRGRDGRVKSIEWNAQRSERIFYASGRDISERLELERDLKNQKELVRLTQENEKYLRTILETAQDAFIVIRDNMIIDANEAFYTMFGYTKEDLATIPMSEIIAEESTPELDFRVERLLKNGHDLFESVNKRKDGSRFQVEISDSCISINPFVSVCFIRDITERKSAEKNLLSSRNLMSYIIEHNRIAIAVHDRDLNYMYVSRPYIEFFKLENKDIIGKNHYDVIPELPQRMRDVHQRVLKGEVVSSGDTESGLNKGSLVNWDCRPWYTDDGSIGGLVLYIENVTERKLAEQALINEKEHFRTTLLSVGDGVISTDGRGVITVMNPVAEKLTGWSFEEVNGRRLEEIFRVVNEQTRVPDNDYVAQVLESERVIEYGNNRVIVSKTGVEVPVEISTAPIRHTSGAVAGVVIIIRDFREKRARQKQIEYLSYNDALTGLYNRRYMEEALKRLDEPENLPLALIAIDVNGLKLTNDAFGHEMGDQLLKMVAGILKIVCKPDDIIGRMGGDELYILLKRTNEAQAGALKKEILKKVSDLKLDPIVVSLAVGYAVKTRPDQDIKAIMTASDNHMYQDKIKFGKIMRSQTIQMVLQNINLNYDREQIHTEKVSHYCEAIARAMNLPEKEVKDIKMAGALHDIGKIMVPPEVLKKPGKLTKEEFDLIKRHPEIGYQMLKLVDEYVHLAEYVLYHHERWDGTGYPTGLRDESIPLCSRIIAVADAFEAMTDLRPYQPIKTKDEAIAELRRCSGIQFDAEIVRIFTEKVL